MCEKEGEAKVGFEKRGPSFQLQLKSTAPLVIRELESVLGMKTSVTCKSNTPPLPLRSC